MIGLLGHKSEHETDHTGAQQKGLKALSQEEVPWNIHWTSVNLEAKIHLKTSTCKSKHIQRLISTFTLFAKYI